MRHKKPSQKAANFQAILGLFILVAFVTGIGMILRGVLLRNQPVNNTRTITGDSLNSSLGNNSPLALNSVDTSVLGTTTQFWANNIQSPFFQRTSLYDLLGITSAGLTSVGRLQSTNFSSKFTLPINAKLLAYLDPETIIFTQPSSREQTATLSVMQSGATTQIHTLSDGVDYTSVFLDVSQKILYFSYQKSGNIVISSIRPSGQEIKLFTVPLATQVKILNVDNNAGKLFFHNDTAGCTSLDLNTKAIADVDCKSIRQDSRGVMLTIQPDGKVLKSEIGKSDVIVYTPKPAETVMAADVNSDFVAILSTVVEGEGLAQRYISVTKLADNTEVAKYNVSSMLVTKIKFNHEGRILAVNNNSQLTIENPASSTFEPVIIPECSFNSCNFDFL